MDLETLLLVRIIVSFIILAGSLWSIIILLNCLGQSEKRVKLMIGLLALALLVRAARISVQIIILNYDTPLYSNISPFDIGVSFITTFLFLWVAIELKAIVGSAQDKKDTLRKI